MGVPVLFLVFNRPEHTKRTLAALLSENPSRVYVSGDGPRRSRAGESELVTEVWRVIEETTWPCPVNLRRLDDNAGCYQAVSSGIDWFFENEQEGAIIEDDVLLAPGGLLMVENLLKVGRDRIDIGSVSAFNGVPRTALSEPESTFRSSIYTSSQAWGTWASRWQHYQHGFQEWETWLPRAVLGEIGDKAFVRHWSQFFDRQATDFTESWDYLWLATNWAMGWNCLVSNTNLSTNVGFDSAATFSFLAPSWYPTAPGVWNGTTWDTPKTFVPDAQADSWLNRNSVGISKTKALKRLLAGAAPKLHRAYRRLRT